jgi:hypothetical protein
MVIDLADWQVESIRTTLFLSQPIDDLAELFTALTGTPAELTQRRRDVSAARGPHEFGDLHVSTDGHRLDVVVAPSSEGPSRPPLRLNASATDALDTLRHLSTTTIERTSASRLGLGLVALHPTTSLADATAWLSSIHPWLKDVPPGSTDIQYRINTPTTTDDGILVNLLRDWSVIRVEHVRLLVTQAGAMTKVDQPSESMPSVRLELDFSTSAESSWSDQKEFLTVVPPLLEHMRRFLKGAAQ